MRRWGYPQNSGVLVVLVLVLVGFKKKWYNLCEQLENNKANIWAITHNHQMVLFTSSVPDEMANRTRQTSTEHA